METDRVDLPEQFIDAISPDAGIAWQACLNSLRVRCDVEVYDAAVGMAITAFRFYRQARF